ncbi:hypothetical protein A5742_23360 [Mycolicibacterium fortuitum]|uniref:Restriction endonuclease n=1 Tax=Mycolicibacterium fortuitum TaxID=1766 RepID=A0ABD6QQN3_MYCFO|nr:hypothetical protein [Mycolicibacterium fortuitum]OMC47620.1 hypothetical protein A5742_23360 [Mycolicibacterium fortuitum]
MPPDPDRRRRRAPEQPDLAEQAWRTAAWIAECNDIDALRNDIKQNFEHLSIPHINYLIATLVIENNLGSDWFTRHVDAGPRKNGTDVFLRRGPDTKRERRDHYMRVLELGRRLFELGQEDFIELLIANLRRQDLASALFEADVVRMLISLPVVIELRPTVGVKGDDYDIDLWLRHNEPFAIEVKSRSESAAYSDSALRSTLEKARRQLPISGHGAVFVKVPELWLEDEIYIHSHAQVIADYLRTTRRVHFVVLAWDEWTHSEGGATLRRATQRSIFRSVNISQDAKFLINSYEKVWETGIDILAPNAPF